MTRRIQLFLISALVAIILAVLVFTLWIDRPTPPDLRVGTAIAPTATTESTQAVPTPTRTPDPSPTPYPTPTPTQTPVPTPTVTPTPHPPDSAAIAMATLISETGANASDVRLLSFEQAEWTSGALGCPEPGVFYTQALVSGWKYLIALGDQVYEFHADDSGDTLVNCTARAQRAEGAINLVEGAGLRQTASIVISRRDFTTGQYQQIAHIEDPAKIEAFLEVLDVAIEVGPRTDCPAIFIIRFDLPGSSEAFDYICPGNNTLFRGDQPFWNGGQGQVPIALGNVVGPYASNDPLPPIPAGP